MGRPRKTGVSPLVIRSYKRQITDDYVNSHLGESERYEYSLYRQGDRALSDLPESTIQLLETGMNKAAESAKTYVFPQDSPIKAAKRAYYNRNRQEILDNSWMKRHPNPTEEQLDRRAASRENRQVRYNETPNGKAAKKRANQKYAQTNKGKLAIQQANSLYRRKIAEKRAAKAQIDRNILPL